MGQAHDSRSGHDIAATTRSDDAEPGRAGLRICLLGEFRVCVAGREVEAAAWRRSRARGLVKLLALSRRGRMHREEVIEQFWPEQDPDAAAANLRVVLHAARQALQGSADGEALYVLVVDDEIVLQRDGRAWVDAEEFEQSAERALRSGLVADMQTALDLYSGELLPEDRYEDWASARRERLRSVHLSVLGRLAGALEQAGDGAGAIDALEWLLAADATDEGAARRLMRAYARAGQRHRALRLFRQVRDALLRDLDAAPEPETQEVYGQILAGSGQAQGSGVATEAEQARQHNLRVPLTSFIGREREVQRVGEALESARLLTLSGPAGSGKTRLALAAGHALLERFVDGVWLADLSPLVSEEPVVSTIAGAMGLALDGGRPEVDALIESLRPKQALLILDNCEHLIVACARLTERLLQECAGLRVLATSREPLHIAGERVLRVPALALPGEQEQTLEQVQDSDAVRLFVDRARSLQPDFALTPESAALVAGICRRLDGLPLAIELAAARVPLLSLEQLAQRLSDPLQVLTGGSRTAEPRQQTLRATLDWSFDALDDAEQGLLGRLSVFAGEWTLEAAERVGSGDGIAERDVLTLLAQLVDKSLLEARAGSGEVRYRMLLTIRQYAGERLAACGEADAWQRRLAEYCVELAEAAEQGLLGAEQGAWLERLGLELDNVRAALDWCERAAETQLQLRIAAALVRMWWIRGYANEGRRWLEGALRVAAAQPDVDAGVLAKGLQAAGNLARMQGEIERAQEHLEACLLLQREHGSPTELAHALNYLAALLGQRGEPQRAIALAEEALPLFQESGELRGLALTLGTLGELTFTVGDSQQSSQHLEAALAVARQIGDTHSIAITLNNLGEALRTLGQLERAAECFEESLGIFRELGAAHGVAYLLANLGDIARGQGDEGKALQHYLEALDVFHGLGYRQAALSVIATLAALDARAGQAQRAAHLLGAEDALRHEAGFALTPFEQEDLRASIAAAQERLSQDVFERAWSAGRQLSLEEAVALAVTVEVAAPPEAPRIRQVQLSPREQDVVRLIAQGLTNQQIATALGMSVRTAETHVRNAMRKLGVSSRREIVEPGRGMRDAENPTP